MFARMLGLAEAAQPFNSITATPPFISDLDLDIIADELPEPVMSSLGQTTKDDRLLYYWAARSFFTGAGTIVDGGALVGSTTTAFAEGLLANAMASKPEQSILVYDLFTDANDGYSANLLRSWFDEKKSDDATDYDFENHFRAATERYAHLLRIYKGDITTLGYTDKRPIEVLSIDVAKTADIMRYMALEFFPRLAPRSLVLHQDYIFTYQPWLTIAMEKLADLFDLVYEVPTQCTAAFMPRKPITRADVEMRLESDFYSLKNASCLYRALERASTPSSKLYAMASISYFYHVMGRPKAAKRVAMRLYEQFRLTPEFIDRTELKHLLQTELGIDYKSSQIAW
jgi:hypothetical protein